MDDGLKLKSTIETVTSAVAEDEEVQVTEEADEVELVPDWVVEEDDALEAVAWVEVPLVDVGVEEVVGLDPGIRT